MSGVGWQRQVALGATAPGGRGWQPCQAAGAPPNHKRASSWHHPPVILTNIDSIPGKAIVQHMGLVQGSTIRAKHIGRDFMAGLKNLVGGELRGYTELLQESRDEALARMTDQARRLGANAVINVRFTTSSVAQGASEILAYGTAVRVE